MKRYVYSILLIGLFMLTTASRSHAEVYLGEVCWQGYNTTMGDVFILKSGVYAREGGRYILNGKISSEGSIVGLFSGNGEIVGGNVMISFVSSGNTPPDKWGDVGNVVLNPSTLNGTFFWVGTHYTEGDVEPLGNHFDEGTLTRIACP